ncbi:MAG: hypothetical protein ILP16_00985 [Spirochaetales bacterium]|nr:hypothetical protein [Spirochaetales bacterium]
MAEKKTEAAALQSIESLAKDPAVHAGVCEMKGWAAGKMVTADEYNAAVNEFLNAPAGAYRS